MSEKEYKECRYIDDQMKFYNFSDFKEDAYCLRTLYDRLKNKLFYKWYIYANVHLSLKQKDIIWSFLNHDIDYSVLDNFD